MSALRTCLLVFALPAFALPDVGADPPKPALKRLYVLRTPGGWLLTVHDDGSAELMFGDGGGPHSYYAPSGTFKPAGVRKALDEVTLDPKGGSGTHFVVWYEEERKGPANGPPPRYMTDEKVIVPLFEAAAAAGKRGNNHPLETLGGKRPGFGLKKK